MNNVMVSVIMSVYNAQQYLDEAIQSILKQTFINFEFIIINDGSTDNSLEIIEKYKKYDKRIIVIDRENRGLIFSLNEGLKKAKGKYIARMDADDISLPNRFQMQVELLEKEKIDICGSWMEVFEENKVLYLERYPERDFDIKMGFLFRNTMGHPTLLFRKESLQEYLNYQDLEDYATWTFLSKQLLFYNIPKVLLKYRKHSNNTCTRSTLQKESFKQLVKDIVNKNNFSIEIPHEHISVFFSEDRYFSSKNLENLENFYIDILALTKNYKKYFNSLKNVIVVKLITLYIKNIFNVRFINLHNFVKLLFEKSF